MSKYVHTHTQTLYYREDTSHEKSKKRAVGKTMRKSVVEMRHKSEMKHEIEVPPGWEMKVQPSTGKTFYVNNTTKETQWVPPVVDAANAMTSSHSMLPAAEGKIQSCFYRAQHLGPLIISSTQSLTEDSDFKLRARGVQSMHALSCHNWFHSPLHRPQPGLFRNQNYCGWA